MPRHNPPDAVDIRHVRPEDREGWLGMRCALWPDGDAAEHGGEIDQFFAGTYPRTPWVVFVAEADGELVGLAEVSTRAYAEGCATSPVAYLEGWFVRETHRRTGIGRALTAAAESWASAQGYVEFASDADPTNEISSAAHEGAGFEDVGTVRCFRKKLPAPE